MKVIKGTVKTPNLKSPLLAGAVFSLIWLAAGALILSLLLYFTDVKESNMNTYTMIVHGAAALFGGAAAGKRSEQKGWYNGGMLGIIYFIMILIISFLAANTSITWHSGTILLTALLAGALGGMIGVNLKK
ncbi:MULTISPECIES: TIGR04086 family membrane protein [unclassified Paenibacillus]|uniref:TIGR04086 family membrane protein n=1 Tax=unclassified Paenibacillus TaxID=185978 RepID=UPI002F4249C1